MSTTALLINDLIHQQKPKYDWFMGNLALKPNVFLPLNEAIACGPSTQPFLVSWFQYHLSTKTRMVKEVLKNANGVNQIWTFSTSQGMSLY